MRKKNPYALLDADFIIKAVVAKKDEQNNLLDWLAVNSGYQFVCHEMAYQEIAKHDGCGAVLWLDKAISNNKVKPYTDKDIVTSLCDFMGNTGVQIYKDYLKISSDSMSATFYEQYYSFLDEFDIEGGAESFLKALHQCDEQVGSAESLGERKAMILLQWLLYFHPDEVYLFLSDDRKARTGLYAVTSVPSKSIMTVFWDMRRCGVDKAEAYTYFYPYERYMTQSSVTSGNIRVIDALTNNQISIPCKQIFDEIFEDRYDPCSSAVVM